MATRTKTREHPDGERIDPPDDLPELIDRERWDGDVVAEEIGVLAWGTHRFHFCAQVFADNETHVELSVPPKPPASAELIVDDWLRGNWFEATIAQLLAREWGIDIEEVLQS